MDKNVPIAKVFLSCPLFKGYAKVALVENFSDTVHLLLGNDLCASRVFPCEIEGVVLTKQPVYDTHVITRSQHKQKHKEIRQLQEGDLSLLDVNESESVPIPQNESDLTNILSHSECVMPQPNDPKQPTSENESDGVNEQEADLTLTRNNLIAEQKKDISLKFFFDEMVCSKDEIENEDFGFFLQ